MELFELRNLQVGRDGRQPILTIDYLDIKAGESLALIGPNGCGKSTLLLTLARLLPPLAGEIWFGGRPFSAYNALDYRRRIGLVLQEPLLLDASVFANAAAGLRFRHLNRAEIAPRVEKWLDRLGVGHLKNRPARQLSGGEAQRVSLARAFALEPDLLLLDEPFAALDAPTRAGLLADFQPLLAESGVTAVFVTHDMDEAMMLADRVAALLDGRLRQAGPPEQVFSAPADPDVAAFVGVETILPGRVVARRNGHLVVDVGGRELEGMGTTGGRIATSHSAVIGQEAFLCVRPEDVTLWASQDLPPSSARNQLSGQVARLAPQGALVKVKVDCGVPVTALITRASAQKMGLAVGTGVTVTFKASATHLIVR